MDERRPEKLRDAERRSGNLVLLVLFVIIVGIGLWLVNAMVDARRLHLAESAQLQSDRSAAAAAIVSAGQKIRCSPLVPSPPAGEASTQEQQARVGEGALHFPHRDPSPIRIR